MNSVYILRWTLCVALLVCFAVAQVQSQAQGSMPATEASEEQTTEALEDEVDDDTPEPDGAFKVKHYTSSTDQTAETGTN